MKLKTLPALLFVLLVVSLLGAGSALGEEASPTATLLEAGEHLLPGMGGGHSDRRLERHLHRRDRFQTGTIR